MQADAIEEAFAALRDVFNEDWVREQTDGQHPMLPELFGATGLSPFSFSYELGEGLRILGQHGLLGNLPRRLKNTEEFDGAHAELNALAQWLEAGARVQRDVPSGNGNKNCDWKVWDGNAVIYGEVKRINVARLNREMSSLVALVFERVMARIGNSVRGRFDLELLIRPKSLAEVQRFSEKAGEIADKIVRHLEACLGKASSDWQVVESLAKYRYVAGKESDRLQGGFVGIPYDMRAEADKTMDVVEEAASQLPSSGPGVVMISGGGRAAGLPFAREAGRRMVERFGMPESPCGHIAGVLIVRSYLVPEHGLTQLSVYVQNPVGPEVNMDLLKRGFPSLEIWVEEEEEAEDGEGTKS